MAETQSTLTLFGFWLGSRSTWVLWLSNLAKSQSPLLWRRVESERTQGNRGWAPSSRHYSGKPPSQGDGGEISTFSTNEGPPKQWTLGAHTEHCAAPRYGSCVCSHVLLFKCLWARCSPSLTSHVSYFFHPPYSVVW